MDNSKNKNKFITWIISFLKNLFYNTDFNILNIFMDSGITTLILPNKDWEKIKEWYVDDKNDKDFLIPIGKIDNPDRIAKLNKSKINEIRVERPCNAEIILHNIISIGRINLPKLNFLRISSKLTILWLICIGYVYYKNGNISWENAETTVKFLFSITYLSFLSLLMYCSFFVIKGIINLLINKYKIYHVQQEKFSFFSSLLPNVFIAYLFTFNFGSIVEALRPIKDILIEMNGWW